jgi:hypothetical protein
VRLALLLVVLSCTACKAPPQTSIRELTLLTRGDCPYAPDLAARLEAALTALHLPNDYQVVDLDTLPKTDPRIGYPTPTILLRNRDVFGMAEPTPPFPEPT